VSIHYQEFIMTAIHDTQGTTSGLRLHLAFELAWSRLVSWKTKVNREAGKIATRGRRAAVAVT
jgi:hypothetical protein